MRDDGIDARVRHIWEFAESPRPSPFLNGSRVFGEGQDSIHLLDQFSGRQPYLHNAKFYSEGALNIAMAPSVLLDSHLLDAIVNRLAGDRSDVALEELIQFAVERGWDFGGYFYLMEQYAKSDAEAFRLHAPRRLTGLLGLLSMDDPEYLRTGEIRPDPEAVAHYLQMEGVSTLADVAQSWVKRFEKNWSRSAINAWLEMAEIAILKMQLIHLFEAPKLGPLKKLKMLEDFLGQTIGLRLGREAHLAIHYFCGRGGSLLGTKANSKFESALRVVRSTAWDLYLMRFPEHSFNDADDLVMVPFVATREAQLAELGKLMCVERIIAGRDGRKTPVLGFRLTGLPDNVREALLERNLSQPKFRIEEDLQCGVPAGLVDALRNEMKRCLEANRYQPRRASS